MTEAKNSAPSTPEIVGHSRLPRWLVAVGFCVPLALIILAACLVGADFVYAMVLLAVAVDPFRFVRLCNYLGDVAHFIIMKPYYNGAIAALPTNQRPRVIVFNWGGMVWASRGLVYDETDQVSLPPGHQSAEWLAQTSNSELGCKGYSVQSLWDHYYLASFPC